VLAISIAVSVVAAMRVVGILLIAAMMVLPVASGQLLARSFRGTMWWSVAIGVGSVVLGLALARIWGLVPSGTIVLIAAACFAVVAIASAAWPPPTDGRDGGLMDDVHATVELRLSDAGQRYTSKRRDLVAALRRIGRPSPSRIWSGVAQGCRRAPCTGTCRCLSRQARFAG
jgi:hypothetical protein